MADPDAIRRFTNLCEQGRKTDALRLMEPTIEANDAWYVAACKAGNVAIVKAVVLKLQLLDFPQSRFVGFDIACGLGHVELVKYFLDVGDCRPDSGLLTACGCGALEVVKLLVDRGAHNIGTAINEASGHANGTEIVRYLLTKLVPRDDICIRDSYILACRCAWLETVQVFLDIGVTSMEPLSYILDRRQYAYLAIFKFYSKFTKRTRGRYAYEEAVEVLCGIFLGLERKGIPRHITRYKIFAYL
jgi:hypothetical protein